MEPASPQHEEGQAWGAVAPHIDPLIGVVEDACLAERILFDWLEPNEPQKTKGRGC